MDPLKLLPGPVAFIWGVATLALFTLRALLDRETWRSPTLREQEKLRKGEDVSAPLKQLALKPA